MIHWINLIFFGLQDTCGLVCQIAFGTANGVRFTCTDALKQWDFALHSHISGTVSFLDEVSLCISFAATAKSEFGVSEDWGAIRKIRGNGISYISQIR